MRTVVQGATGAAILSLCTIVQAQGPIGVEVNGKPVQFGAVQPQRISGRVFIPLRAVVESLGAEIKWEAATQTIRGGKGERTFELRIGSNDALVNMAPVRLEVPAQMISGTTMVPLRFVAEALGAEVEWNAAQRQVSIQAAEAAPAPAAASRVEGEIVAVRATANPPTVTVVAGGVRQTLSLSGDSIILRGAPGQTAQQVKVGDLEPGDAVVIRLQADTGTVAVLQATGGGAAPPASNLKEAEIVAIRDVPGGRAVTLRTPDGRERFSLRDDTLIQRIIGTRPAVKIGLEDLKVGDQIRYQADRNGDLRRLESVQPAPANDGNVTGEVVAVRATTRPASLIVKTGDSRAAYDVSPEAVILRKVGNARGVRVTLDELEPGDMVSLRLDREGRFAQLVEATGAGKEPEPVAVVDRDLKITSFTHDAKDVLKLGSEVRFSLVGTPGAVALVEVGSLEKALALKEEKPGRYTGTLLVPKGVTVKDLTPIAQLRVGNRTAPLVQAPTAVTVDSEPPRISETAPGAEKPVTSSQPDIYAEISDGAGSGIDSESVRVSVRGQDVTSAVKVTGRFLLYTPPAPLPAGDVPVKIALRDLAGNLTEAAWTFTISPVRSVLTSITHSGVDPLAAGSVLTVSVRGPQRGRGSFSIDGLTQAIPLTEGEAGVYTGRYTVRPGDEAVKAKVLVDFVTAAGRREKGEASAPVTIAGKEAVAPALVTPRPGVAIRLRDELLLEGTGAPGSKITVEVSWEGRAFGALPLTGAVGSQEVTVDKDGKWASEPFVVRLGLGVKKPELTVRLTPNTPNSKPVVVKIQTR